MQLINNQKNQKKIEKSASRHEIEIHAHTHTQTNTQLAYEIIQKDGVIISELPFDQKPKPSFFDNSATKFSTKLKSLKLVSIVSIFFPLYV